MAVANQSNAIDFPDALIDPAHLRSRAVYCDVNPVPNAGLPDLLYDAAAVIAALRNLFLCPRGGRSRIFGGDYFSDMFSLLQEPFDDLSAGKISSSLYQSLQQWEPRLTLYPNDVRVLRDSSLPGYIVSVVVRINGTTTEARFPVPVQ